MYRFLINNNDTNHLFVQLYDIKYSVIWYQIFGKFLPFNPS